MKRFMAFAAAALTLGALFGAAQPSLAQNRLELRVSTNPTVGPPPVGVILPDAAPTLSLDLFYIPQDNGQVTPPIRTSTFQSFVLFDKTKFSGVEFDTTIDNQAGVNVDGRPTAAQRNALAPTNRTISSINVQGTRTLNSFNSPVDNLGANPDGFLNVINLFDGSASSPSAVAGLAFPPGGFKLGTYTFTFATDDNTGLYSGTTGNTVIGFADLLTISGQTLSSQERAVVGSNQDPQPSLQLDGVYRFAVVPAPSSVAVFALGGLMPLVAIARRRRAAK
jgi:hypothetical protein